MRRVLLVAAVLGGLLAVGLVLVVVNLDRIVAANRDRILAGVSAGFARAVEVDTIGVSLRGGLGIRLEGLRVADDPAFSRDAFLTADAAHALVRLWPLVRREVVVKRVVVEAPHVTLLRTARGMNVDSLGRRPGSPGAPAASGGSAAAAGGLSPAIAVALLNIRHGTIRIVDRSGAKPVEHTVAPLDVTLSDLSVTTPMTVRASATLAGAAPTHVNVQGTIGPVGEPPFAADVPLELQVGVRGPGLALPDAAVSGRMRRDEVGRPFTTLRIVAPKLDAGGVTVRGLQVDVAEKEGVATLDKLALGVFGGTVEGGGRVEHGGEVPRFELATKVRGVDLEQGLALGSADAARRLEGRLDADWSFAGSAGDEAVVRRTLTGTGHVEVHEGAIRDVNLADGVLSGVTGMAGVATLVPPRIRDRYPDIFSTDDTRFDQLTADIQIAGGRIRMNPFVVAARDYTIRGEGTITFEQRADVTATLVASERLTADVIGALKEARYLTDDAGRLAIPFRVAGVLPDVKAKPDEAFIARVVRRALVGEGLESLLGGGDANAGEGKHGGDKREKSGDVLKRGLDKLFGR